MNRILLLAAMAALMPMTMSAQTPDGGITPEVMARVSKGYSSIPFRQGSP